jgi:hypothetical protein
MDYGTRMNAHMPIQGRDPPNRRVFNHAAEPDTLYSGPARSLQAWGAKRAKGAPPVHNVPPHLSGYAKGPNPYGIRLYTVPDTESGAYRRDSHHGWEGVRWNEGVSQMPSTWDNTNAMGQKLLY